MSQSSLDDKRRDIMKSESDLLRSSAHEMARWILGTLLLINGGAIVALIGNDTTRTGLLGIGGWLFLGGLACTLLGGTLFFYFTDTATSSIDDRLWSGAELDDNRLAMYDNKDHAA